MKMFKILFTCILLFICLLVGCNNDKEYKIEVDLPDTLTVGDVFEPIVMVDDKVASSSKVEFMFTNNNLIYNEGIISAVSEGTTGVVVKYDGKSNFIKNIQILPGNITITYNLNGGECSNLVTSLGKEDVIKLPIPTKKDFVFCGWKDQNGKVYLKLDSSIENDLELTASWHELDDDGYAILDISTFIGDMKSSYYLDEEYLVEDVEIYIEGTPQNILDQVYNLQVLYDARASINQQKADVENVNQMISGLELASSKKDLVENIISIYNKIPDQNLERVENIELLTSALLEVDNVIIDLDKYIPNKIDEAIALPQTISNMEIEWTCSDENLIKFDGNNAVVQKAYLAHTKKEADIIANFEYRGFSASSSKTISVDPILFDVLPSSPVCAYINDGALYHYEEYNGRNELFSEQAKETLDMVYFSFVVPQSSGKLLVKDNYLQYLPQILELKNNGVRVLLCLGGGGTSQAFSDIAADDVKLNNYISEIINLVVKYGFSGVDIDWEYPGYESSRPTAEDSANYVKMFKLLRAELDKVEDNNSSQLLITSAIPGTSWGLDRYDVPELNKYLDYVNIMSYDLNNSSKSSHLSPLYSVYDDGGFGFSSDWAVKEFTARGFLKSKLIIGVATYGKVYRLTGPVTSDKCLNQIGTLSQISGVVGSFTSGTIYYYGIEQLLKQPGYNVYYDYSSDNKLAQSYIYNESEKIFITYEDATTISEKYKYAKQNGIGIMCWSIPEDATDLYINTIYAMK